MGQELAKIESFRAELAKAETFQEIQLIKSKTDAIAEFAKRLKLSKEKQDEIGEFRIEVQAEQGAWLDKHFPHGVKAEDRRVDTMSTHVSSMKELGVNERQSSQSRLIANEPELVKKAIESIKANENQVVTPNAVATEISKIKKQPHVSHNSGENEWYTPINIIESARKVLNEIDLDPASSEIANINVKAKNIFTILDNGLQQKWFGNIWLNPPYAQPLISFFIDKLCNEKTYSQAIVLVNNATETNWGNTLLKNSKAVCFPKGRIKFLTPEGKEGAAPLQGQMICYLGNNEIDFINEFSKYGLCLKGA